VKLTLSNSDTPGHVLDPLSNRVSNRRVRNASLFAAGALIYWALVSLTPFFSGLNITRISPFFVGAAGYFLGFSAGTAASLSAIVIHTLVFNGLGYEGPFAAAQVNPAAHVGILFIGPLAGALRSVTRKLKLEATRRKAAEHELRDTELQFRQMVDTVRGVFWIRTEDPGRMVYVSPTFESVFGIPAKRIENNPNDLLEIVHPDDRPRLEKTLTTPPDDDRQLEYRIVRPDGAERWIRTRTFVSRDENGEVQRITAVSIDTTEGRESRTALQASEGKYRDLVEKIPAIVYISHLDLSLSIQYVSPQIEYLLGYSQNEWMTEPDMFDKLYHPEDAPRVTRELTRCIRKGTRFVADFRMIAKTGTVRWFHSEADIVRNERGEPLFVQGVMHDITLRRYTETLQSGRSAVLEKLAAGASLPDILTTLVESTEELVPNSVCSIALLDREANFVYCGAISSLPAEFVELADRVEPDPDSSCVGRAICTGERVIIDDVRHCSLDETFRERAEAADVRACWVEPIRSTRGEILGALSIYISNTSEPSRQDLALLRSVADLASIAIEQRRTEAALRENEEKLRLNEKRYRQLFEDDLSGDFIATPSGKLITCNDAFVRIFGFESVDDALFVNISSLFPTSAVWDDFVNTLTSEQRMVDYEEELRSKDGKSVYVVANFVGGFDGNGNLMEIKGYLFDITARKRLEEQLIQAQKMEAVGRLAGGIAHDFNNSLTSISGYAELLINKLDADDPLRRYAREVMKAADRAAGLTKRLLAFSRQQMIQPRVIDLNMIVNNMETVLRRTIGEDIELQKKIEAEACVVEADPSLIETVIMNLAINARDAMPDGGELTIRTGVITIDEASRQRTPGIEPGKYVLVTLSDTGVGMDDETKARIFEPFFTTKKHGRGTGLGLSTVYGAVCQSGGHVRVSSHPGSGTTFRLYFPTVEDRKPVATTREMFLGPSQGSETVLVAEDEPAVQRLIKDVLQNKGYRVLSAVDGEEALGVAAAEGGNIDLLITDVVMPRMNGRDLADELRARNPLLKVLYISGYVGKSSVKIAALGPGTSFLSKPFSPEALARKSRLLLDAPPADAGASRRRSRLSHNIPF
jgi:PAS domain S-box-containing protein